MRTSAFCSSVSSKNSKNSSVHGRMFLGDRGDIWSIFFYLEIDHVVTNSSFGADVNDTRTT